MKVVFYAVASPYAHEMRESVERLGGRVVAYVHNLDDRDPPADLEPVVGPGDLAVEWLELPVVIPLVTPAHRKTVGAEVAERGFGRLATIVDPSAVVAASAGLSEGVTVNAGSVVGARSRLERLVLVNRSVSIGHDCVAEEYATFGPGCVLCGDCTVEAGAFVGAGAVLTPGIRVGRNAIVGAGSVVLRDVAEHTLVVGNPARVAREGIAGYNDVSV